VFLFVVLMVMLLLVGMISTLATQSSLPVRLIVFVVAAGFLVYVLAQYQ
jgi:hypothetical protein